MYYTCLPENNRGCANSFFKYDTWGANIKTQLAVFQLIYKNYRTLQFHRFFFLTILIVKFISVPRFGIIEVLKT